MKLFEFIKNVFKNNKSVNISDIAFENATQNVYYYLLAIGIAKSIISNAVSKCDFRFYYNGIEKPKSQEYYRWNIRPNRNQNGTQFKKQIISKLIENNEVLIFEKNDELFIADDYFKNNLNGTQEITFENVTYNSVKIFQSIKRSEVVFIKLNNENISQLIAGVTSSLGAVLNYAINGYKSANSSKYKIKIKSFSEGDPDIANKLNEIKSKQLEPFMNSLNAVFPEFEGNELSKLENGVSKTSANIIDLRKDIFTVVSNALNIPKSILLGDKVDDKETMQFISDCIEPILKEISTEINYSQFTFEEFERGNHCDIDVSAISTTLISSIANGIEKLISSGTINIDEVRENILHLPVLNTEFSTKYWITKNFEEIEIALKGGEENNEE